jgi:hypothetical protein
VRARQRHDGSAGVARSRCVYDQYILQILELFNRGNSRTSHVFNHVQYEYNGQMFDALSNDFYYIVPEKCTECVGHFDQEQIVLGFVLQTDFQQPIWQPPRLDDFGLRGAPSRDSFDFGQTQHGIPVVLDQPLAALVIRVGGAQFEPLPGNPV